MPHSPRLPRSHRVISPLKSLGHPALDMAVFGNIPDGCANLREQEAADCVTVDAETPGTVLAHRSLRCGLTALPRSADTSS